MIPALKEKSKAVLIRAAELVEAGWTRGTFALNKDKEPVMYYDNDATCFCAVGAIRRATLDVASREMQFNTSVYDAVVDEVRGRVGICNIPTWNDRKDQTQEGVAKVLRAIAESIT